MYVRLNLRLRVLRDGVCGCSCPSPLYLCSLQWSCACPGPCIYLCSLAFCPFPIHLGLGSPPFGRRPPTLKQWCRPHSATACPPTLKQGCVPLWPQPAKPEARVSPPRAAASQRVWSGHQAGRNSGTKCGPNSNPKPSLKPSLGASLGALFV